MSISYWLDQSASSHKNYDVVVIGAGIAGLSSAFWLQEKDPSLKIAVIEKDRVAFGASGRNAGFVTCGSTEHFIKLQEQFGLEKAVEIWKFSEVNRHLLAEHVMQGHPDSVDFRQTGSCTVAPSQQHWEKYQATAAVMKKAGIDVYEVGPREMQEDYGVTGFVGGIQYAGDGFVHPVKLLEKLRARLKVDIYEGTEVFAIDEKNGSVSIRSDKGTFTAGKVLLTMNAFLPLLMKDFEKSITPGRAQILLTEPLPAFVKGPCYLTKHLCYFRQLPTGHLLIGGFRNLALEAENTFADQTTSVIQNALIDFVRDHFKPAAQARIAYQWSGLMAFTQDGQMLIGPAPHKQNIHLMAGCCGHGMGLSFHAAKVLVGSLYGEKIPAHLDIARLN